MGPGGIFGNIRGAAKYLTTSNVIASRNIDLLRIDGSDFYAILKVRKCVYYLRYFLWKVQMYTKQIIEDIRQRTKLIA